MYYLSHNKIWETNKDYNIDKLLYLLIDRPDRITVFNDFVWCNIKNQSHRNYDLPAVVWYENDYGEAWWYENSKVVLKIITNQFSLFN